MSRLTKEMYGREFQPASSLFGLRCGQRRDDDLVHNGGWYNKAGERLGWGDLSHDDLQRIAAGLQKGELFIVLPERASFWNYATPVDQPSPVHAPGVEYVAEHARYVIAPDALFFVDQGGSSTEEGRRETAEEGLTFQVLRASDVVAMMVG